MSRFSVKHLNVYCHSLLSLLAACFDFFKMSFRMFNICLIYHCKSDIKLIHRGVHTARSSIIREPQSHYPTSDLISPSSDIKSNKIDDMHVNKVKYNSRKKSMEIARFDDFDKSPTVEDVDEKGFASFLL